MGERFPAQGTRFRSFNSAEGEAGGGDSDSAERTELIRRVSLQHHVGIRGITYCGYVIHPHRSP